MADQNAKIICEIEIVQTVTGQLKIAGCGGMPLAKWTALRKRDTFCDTPNGGVLRAYKDLRSHRGLVSC